MGFQIRGPETKQKQIQAEIQTAFAYIRRQKWTAPADADVNDVHANITLLTTTQSITTNITNPDFARIITIKGTKAGGSLTGDVVITGTNIRGEALTDTIALNDDNTVAGVKAFKTVTQIDVPVRVTAADAVSIGFSDALGLDRCMNGDEVLAVTLDGVYETTRPTVTFHSTDVSKNTVDPNTALNTSKNVVVDFVTTEKTQKKGTTA